MLIKIQKLIVITYGELLKERTRKLIFDLALLIFVFISMRWIESATAQKTIMLLNTTYKLNILLFYLLGFFLIISTKILFTDFRNFLNISTSFIITRFPRMKGEFTPGKMILRDFIQIILLFLIFSPISELIKGFSFKGIEATYAVSLFFIVLCLIFSYNILINFLKIIHSNTEKLILLFKGSMKNEH